MRIPNRCPEAIARMAGGEEAPCLYGTVKFYEIGNNILVTSEICGLPKSQTGIFALHIHEGTGCTGPAFNDAGSHYNPQAKPHPQHAGDLPPLLSCDGKAFLAVMTNRFCLQEVMGRTVVIHSGSDDFHTQPAGNSGAKIACGVIRPF